MDYLSRCYRAEMRPFRDSDDTVTVRWYFAPVGAKVYPGIHRFGSQVWRETADDPPDGPGEIFGPKPYDPGTNPGYKGDCIQGPAEWYMSGLPRCCFIPPQPDWGSADGWRAFTVARPRDLAGERDGFSGATAGGGAAELGGRSGWQAVTSRGYAGLWGGRAGLVASEGVGSRGLWGGLSGLLGPAGFGSVGLWGGLSGMEGVSVAKLCRVRQNVSTTLTPGDNYIPFHTQIYDPHSMWSNTNPSRITASDAGLWIVCAGVQINSTASGYVMYSFFRKNGSELVRTFQLPSYVGLFSVTAAALFAAAAGDYFEVNSGNGAPFNQSTWNDSVDQPWFSAAWLGPLT